MPIIDAHLHLFSPSPQTDAMAAAVGHIDTAEYLEQYYPTQEIAMGIVMSNHTLDPAAHRYPPFLRYCIGLDGPSDRCDAATLHRLVEENLRQENCVGIKLYPGYNACYITDPCFDFVYALAAKYHKVVAVHTGMTAMPRARLRYCHPLTIDDAAALHPEVQFVMCHFGNPFLADAAAVLEKNRNVAADLSGLLEGPVDLQEYSRRQAGYLAQLKTWIAYVDDDERFLFGTDFPAVNIPQYIAFIRSLFPRSAWEKVFFQNANRIYQLGLPELHSL